MIAERLDQLERSQRRWKEHAVGDSSPSIASSPLNARLAALTASSENWRRRVKKDDEVRALTPRGKIEAAHGTAPLPSSFFRSDKGLDRFWSNGNAAERADTSHPLIDVTNFDAVPKTEFLKTPRRPVPNRKTRGRARVLKELTAVQAGDDIRERFVQPVYEDDTGAVAKSAQIGLASKEDYGAVKLQLKEVSNESPYPEIMLIRLRGEKQVDVRLVCPKSPSVHPFGVFLLVTRTRLFVYHGQFCNIMEKTRAAQMTITILQKEDLCCNASSAELVTSMDSDFWKLLGGAAEDPARTNTAFEIEVSQVNTVFRVLADGSVQTALSKEQPRASILQPHENLIFDFGSELYVWCGRTSSRKGAFCAERYAEQLMEKGVAGSERLFGEKFSGEVKRPQWVLARKMALGVYDVLFSSKFPDWKWDGEQRRKSFSPVVSPGRLLSAEDALRLGKELALKEPQSAELLLEDTLVSSNPDVVTETVNMWILDGEILDRISFTTRLYQSKCYVLKWSYRIQVSGVRRLRTHEESQRETGRQRVAYFYWLGRDTTKKQQGLCALGLRELDNDRRPHIRVDDGLEPPLFLSLFNGKLVVENGKSGLFLVLGSSCDEGHAVELDSSYPLRTHAVYIKVDSRVRIGVGGDSNVQSVRNGLVLADMMLKQRKKEGLAAEGEEMEESIDDDPWLKAEQWSAPRLFRVFEGEAHEVESPQWNTFNPFPHTQSSLSQTVLVETKQDLWIWSEQAPTTFVLRVAAAFWTERGTPGPAKVVRKGAEPSSFRALFPTWIEWEGVDGKEAMRSLDELLEERTRVFPLDKLRRKELPEGMDTSNLQDHLSDVDFREAFGMDRAQFYALPSWKQIIKRKEAQLF